MDDAPKTADSSLAFVDVITNGLGGMLVLFFIVVLLQTTLEWNGESLSDQAIAAETFPFVIIVRSANHESCFDISQNVWQSEGLPIELSDKGRGENFDWGADYAFFLSPSPLNQTKTRLSVRTSTTAELSIEVYPAGAARQDAKVLAVAGSVTEIWPRLRGAP